MKINKIKKMNSGKYKIELDNKDTIITYDEVILKRNLLFNPNLNSDDLNELYKDTNYYDIYFKIVKLISKRLRSEKEIIEYLSRNNITDYDIIIDKLKSINLINDNNFAKAYVYDRTYLSKDGLNKIMNDLSEYNISKDIIDLSINELEPDVFKQKLENIIIKKINQNTKYSNYVFKQKLVLELVNLGYEISDIEDLYEKNKKINNNILKEYEKLKKKLSTKYDKEKLYYQIRNKLYQKGYSYSEIEEIKQLNEF